MTSNKRGIIIKWFDDKGYGFIQPVDGATQIFFHVRSIRTSARRDLLGQRVIFREIPGKGGRPAADDVYLAVEDSAVHRTSNPTPHQRRHQGMLFAKLMAWLVSLGFMAGLGIAIFRGTLPIFLLYVYTGMSALTFLFYAADKSQAGTGAQRTPENTLHTLELLCGWPGALIAQWQIRHKNRKTQYQVMFWIMVMINVGTLFYLTHKGILHKIAGE